VETEVVGEQLGSAGHVAGGESLQVGTEDLGGRHLRITLNRSFLL
jgi:hypothetical protein